MSASLTEIGGLLARVVSAVFSNSTLCMEPGDSVPLCKLGELDVRVPKLYGVPGDRSNVPWKHCTVIQ